MEIREWLLLLVTVLVGLVGLFWASGPEAGASYGFGLLLFGAAVVCGFLLVKQHFDRIDSGRH